MVALVPRSLWPGKPIGFGAELVPFLRPELVGSGHSSAALFFGEWFFNFGALGLVLMMPATGLAIRGLDRLLIRYAARPILDRRAVLNYAAATLAVTGLFDLAWVGTFTYVARSGTRMLFLAAPLVLFGCWRARKLAPLAGANTWPSFAAEPGPPGRPAQWNAPALRRPAATRAGTPARVAVGGRAGRWSDPDGAG